MCVRVRMRMRVCACVCVCACSSIVIWPPRERMALLSLGSLCQVYMVKHFVKFKWRYCGVFFPGGGNQSPATETRGCSISRASSGVYC